MNPLPRSLALLALASTVAAQGYLGPIAYPHGTVTETGSTVLPLGTDPANPAFDESRFQILIPATHLPTYPTTLLAMELIPMGHSGSFRYETLTVNASHTTATALGPQFDANLPSPSALIPGFTYTTTLTDGQWSMIFFPNSFAYNGTHNLVLDIQKVFNPADGVGTAVAHQINTNGPRVDLPQSVGAHGAYGSGASTAATATLTMPEPFKIRLIFDGIPTMQVSSDVGGSQNRVFPIGGTADIKITGPGSIFALFADGAFQAPYTVPIAAGQGRVGLGLNFDIGIVQGLDTVRSIPIPSTPALVGTHLVFQMVTADAGLTTLSFGNATDFYLNTN